MNQNLTYLKERKLKDLQTLQVIILFVLVLTVLNLIIDPTLSITALTVISLISLFFLMFKIKNIKKQLANLRKLPNGVAIYKINKSKKPLSELLTLIPDFKEWEEEAFNYDEFLSLMNNHYQALSTKNLSLLILLQVKREHKEEPDKLRLLEGVVCEEEDAKKALFFFKKVKKEEILNKPIYFLKRQRA